MKLKNMLIHEALEKVDWMKLVREDANNRECNYIVNWHLTLQLKEQGYVVNTHLVNKYLNRYVKEGLLIKKTNRNYCTYYILTDNDTRKNNQIT